MPINSNKGHLDKIEHQVYAWQSFVCRKFWPFSVKYEAIETKILHERLYNF